MENSSKSVRWYNLHDRRCLTNYGCARNVWEKLWTDGIVWQEALHFQPVT
ncbi:MAG TPA: hypothetical protein VE344_02440 [Methylomirabilota bacterium]|nr:hypothetical protein [Methylomirabilota bacterium]